MSKKTKEIEIEGVVSIPVNMTHDEFSDKFLNFIKDEGWLFGGMTRESDEE